MSSCLVGELNSPGGINKSAGAEHWEFLQRPTTATVLVSILGTRYNTVLYMPEAREGWCEQIV